MTHFFKRFDHDGSPLLTADGAVWVAVSANGESRKVGVSASNILSRQSDAGLAREVLLARASHVLKSPARGRETFIEFQQDWAALQRASAPLPIKTDDRVLTSARVAAQSAGSTAAQEQ